MQLAVYQASHSTRRGDLDRFFGMGENGRKCAQQEGAEYRQYMAGIMAQHSYNACGTLAYIRREPLAAVGQIPGLCCGGSALRQLHERKNRAQQNSP